MHLRPLKKYSGRFLITILGALLLSHASCAKGGSHPEQLELSDDEKYLVLAYAQLRYAENLYPDRPETAESLFTDLHSSIDSTRIANTIRLINNTPDRWIIIFRKIEEMLQEASTLKR